MALTITVHINDDDEKCLANDLLDINEWVQDAVKGKINQCAKRLDNEWRPKLDRDPTVTAIPADRVARRAIIFARSDYRDRLAREAEPKPIQAVQGSLAEKTG